MVRFLIQLGYIVKQICFQFWDVKVLTDFLWHFFKVKVMHSRWHFRDFIKVSSLVENPLRKRRKPSFDFFSTAMKRWLQLKKTSNCFEDKKKSWFSCHWEIFSHRNSQIWWKIIQLAKSRIGINTDCCCLPLVKWRLKAPPINICLPKISACCSNFHVNLQVIAELHTHNRGEAQALYCWSLWYK